ncbi:hypothetical protein [Mesorhizobium huakuii]|uniref:Uncharacterized protein n=1 Tax=Mesorhizobium huakuii TaxID=28104 RepID=A0A7G6T0Y6_9HYPH|nr:hypothetical protein [Mesorhizobium huakuii]QND60418.1 hypothetical protein HB778_30620 [Mesorhizobium huakuii]
MNVADARKVLLAAGYVLADRPPTRGTSFTNEIVLSVFGLGSRPGLAAIGVIYETAGDTSDRDVEWFVTNAGTTGLTDRVSIFPRHPNNYRVLELLPAAGGWGHSILVGDFVRYADAISAARSRHTAMVFTSGGRAVGHVVNFTRQAELGEHPIPVTSLAGLAKTGDSAATPFKRSKKP